ncbi:hypothetical protein A2852_01285 [Candidatus Adlerbacteria bacterium RIFCSPHIGHO2_01_FULL_54_23]|uniref:Phosphatase n=3 Tax=Candidatus Adleribacteriota TaxID=1752736 RepID=A0A1F4Y1Z9_9BACT|nr:MAG: Phosphatase [Candidatus Adlerbacteria bacterium GW2011_GWA1_54_10]KKW36374.1 MAG: Phosphatase [Candidatus Adlerbacteria bacterium GW2011_GWA2_54_12]KKW37474.1 MAG: Phosphatase [Candidatus Adlerbacteria bacterium GW2011_GWB1_54_7]OGC79243.1 MAG: hypothetical protein A2852_01285 [Candidatus Adlerbacteria bacterium RIFCSPHIGHO2_01_FULL_54_23]OGC87353.1 MAG: hypothetical protein A3B33_00175 [Candidatus Adlerbacteria bacterium RIFCSPLOWO2_01_FULL_54_16]
MTRIRVLDFDGVVARRSEFFKKEAWALVFAHYGARHEPFLREASGDRFSILEKVYEKLGESPEHIPTLVQDGSRVFDEYVQRKISEAGVDNETRLGLADLSDAGSLYINSATPTGALKRSVRQLRIEEYFTDVLGRPRNKVENFKEIAARERAKPAEILFVGDGDNDYAAAQEFGCAFLGFANDWNNWAEAWKPFPVVSNFNKIKSH